MGSGNIIPKGSTALVTGASSGIGLEFAKQLAALEINVVLVSNEPEKLEIVCNDLSSKYTGLKFNYINKDLTDSDSAEYLLERCNEKGITVDILINNAGIFAFKEMLDMSRDHLNLFIDLHIRTVTQLCYVFGNEMCKRKQGYILNMSSMSCWMPMPGISMYSATKSYIRTLSRALYVELKESGVSVTVACPGGIATDLFGLPENLQRLGVRLGALSTAERFVYQALQQMFLRKKQFINGFINHISIPLVASTPTWLRLKIKHKLLDK